MKSTTIETMYKYLNGETVDVEALRADVTTEYQKIQEEKQEKADMYAAAKEVLRTVLSAEPKTANELLAATGNWPEGFTIAQLRYGLRSPGWADLVDPHDNGKNPKTYSVKVA